MNVDLYEKLWMWAAGVVVVLFIGIIAYTAVADGLRPPSHIETIDPAQLSSVTVLSSHASVYKLLVYFC
jgi:cytochrome c oxidase subunit 2